MKRDDGLGRYEYLEEQVRMACVRLQVERTTMRLQTISITRSDAEALIEQTRRQVLAFCPDKEEVFELVLRPRFQRLFRERVLAEWGLADAVN